MLCKMLAPWRRVCCGFQGSGCLVVLCGLRGRAACAAASASASFRQPRPPEMTGAKALPAHDLPAAAAVAAYCTWRETCVRHACMPTPCVGRGSTCPHAQLRTPGKGTSHTAIPVWLSAGRPRLDTTLEQGSCLGPRPTILCTCGANYCMGPPAQHVHLRHACCIHAMSCSRLVAINRRSVAYDHISVYALACSMQVLQSSYEASAVGATWSTAARASIAPESTTQGLVKPSGTTLSVLSTICSEDSSTVHYLCDWQHVSQP